jgi:hypothetical protein
MLWLNRVPHLKVGGWEDSNVTEERASEKETPW